MTLICNLYFVKVDVFVIWRETEVPLHNHIICGTIYQLIRKYVFGKYVFY